MKLWSFINEKNLAENLIKNNKLINDSPRDYIIAYIKYLKNEKGYSKNKIRNSLDDFLIKNLVGFIVADWEDKLQRWVNRYSQKKYCSYKQGKNIKITLNELNKIKEIGDINTIKAIEIEKILFIMLILAKSTYSEGKDLWCNYPSKDIFKLSRYKYKQKSDSHNLQREYLLYDLKETTKDEYIEFGGENVKLLYGNDKSDIVFNLDLDENNIDNIILEYLNWRNLSKYKYCSICGKEIKLLTNNSNKSYCTKCNKIIKLKQNNESYYRIKENVK